MFDFFFKNREMLYFLQSEPSPADDDEGPVRELRRAENAGRGRCASSTQNVSGHKATHSCSQEVLLWKAHLQ